MKIKGRLWFDWKNGWWICRDLDPPSWVMSKEKGHEVQAYSGDALADFLSTIGIKSGQAFEIEIKNLDTDETKTYWDGRFDDVKRK